MKLLWIAPLILANLSGASRAAAQNTDSPDPRPVMNVGPRADVTPNGERNQTAIRDYAFRIEAARKGLVRDNQTLADDSTRLLDARSVHNERAITQAQSDIQKDKRNVEKDRDLLKKNLTQKIADDRLSLRGDGQKVEVAEKYLRRDSRKASADDARLADARSRYEAEEIRQRTADIDQDRRIVNADNSQLSQDRQDQTALLAQLEADQRHLAAADRNLNEDDDTAESLRYKNRDTDAR